MHLRHELTYDAAPADVYAVLADPAFTGEGTVELVELVELEVTVKVPLIGAKLEKLMIDTITSGLAVEQTVGTAWLAGEN